MSLICLESIRCYVNPLTVNILVTNTLTVNFIAVYTMISSFTNCGHILQLFCSLVLAQNHHAYQWSQNIWKWVLCIIWSTWVVRRRSLAGGGDWKCYVIYAGLSDHAMILLLVPCDWNQIFGKCALNFLLKVLSTFRSSMLNWVMHVKNYGSHMGYSRNN